MPINPSQPYPMYNSNNPRAVLPIPDNINRQFGKYIFSFNKGTKNNFITKQYNGDYIICINNRAWFDIDIWNLFVNNVPSNSSQIVERSLLIVEKLWNMQQIEQNIFDLINNFNTNFPNTYNSLNNLNIPLDVIQTFLYFSWHRCHIEERAYPSVNRLNGRGDYLGATYILFANKYNLQPLNNTLKSVNYSNPNTVYKMANNSNNQYPNFRHLKRLGFSDYLNLIRNNRGINL